MVTSNENISIKPNLFNVVFVLIVAFASFSFSSLQLNLEDEICDNAIDDDDDGLIDLNDPDCECLVVEPVSIIPNPSFEEIDCCPQMQSELACASTWIQASFPTTDFIHNCGWLGWNDENSSFPPPQPFPDGDGIVGFRNGVYFPPGDSPNPMGFIEPNWKEYAGACLLSPMLADSIYLIQFDIGFVNPTASPPINVTLFGTTDCANLPFGAGEDEPLTGCPTNVEGWVELGSVPVLGGEDIWIKTAIEIVPDEDILAIAFEIESFQVNISTVSNPCEEDFALQVEGQTGLSYQWYKEGIALIGETAATLSQLYGVGNYQVRTMNETDCVLSGIYAYTIPVLSTTINQSICEGEVFQFGGEELTEAGYYADTLVTGGICDSIIYLDLLIENEFQDTLIVEIFEGETFEIEEYKFNEAGEYLISLTSPNGCDKETLLLLSFYSIYIPNVFSPNYDGINDKFTVQARTGLIANIDMTIFDRWGGIIYQGPEWDGQEESRTVNPGVYVYLIELTLSDGTSHIYSGSVTVLF